MNMKEHILAALQEQFQRWEELLASLSDEQISAQLAPSTWSIKDVLLFFANRQSIKKLFWQL